MKHYGDITKLHGELLEPVDIIIGGSPCQNLSIAGNRQGLSSEQSSLFLEQIRVVKESRKYHRKPRFMLWENVPGALTSNSGEDFQRVLEETVHIKEESISIPRPEKWANSGCIMGDGFSVAWRVHDAQYWGVPQRRRRIALIADFDGQCAGEILFEPKGLRGDSAESGETREKAAGVVDRGIDADIERKIVVITQNSFIDIGVDIAPTLKSTDYKRPCLVSYTDNTKYSIRRLTPLEYERLQGYPCGWTDIGEWTDAKGKTHKTSDTARYKALGNSIALPFWQWLLERFAPYLPESPTMGSLFDGIGGFPLCWERIYGKGTAVWASEIEPFCVAVTERRFNNIT